MSGRPIKRTLRRRPNIRRHTTLPQSWIQRENWEFETHTRPDTSAVNPNVALARLGSMQFSYNGTFELDESTMTIAHRVEHSTSVARLGKTYTWLIESIDTDNLVLSAKLGNETGMPASLRGLNSTRWQRTP